MGKTGNSKSTLPTGRIRIGEAERYAGAAVCRAESLPTLEEAALQLMNEAMRRADGNQSIASRLLGISQPALSKRLKRLLG